MLSKESSENAIKSGTDACENTHPYSSDSLKNAIFQELREEVKTLKLEILFLKDELIKDRQRIIVLESKKKSHGKEVKKRVDSMILLINDYGGSMTTSSVKAYMGLSKDELYRTLKCAKDEGLIEILPDPRDRRGHILNIKFQKINI
ncbi:MAG: MarR family transcriptional regulator [Methanothrix sp.]|nr:MarR family transcriptional regulator [Methanothrix sp.]